MIRSYISRVTDALVPASTSKLVLVSNKAAYSKLEIDAFRVAISDVLLDIGINPRQRVVLITKNEPHAVLLLLGLLSIDAIPVLVEWQQSNDDILSLLSGETIVITDQSPVPISEGLRTLRAQSLMDLATVKLSGTSNQRRPNLPDLVDPDRTLLIVHTTGSSSLPKKVHYSEANVAWAVEQYAMLYNVYNNDTVAFVMPFSCSLGIVPCGLMPMLYGCRIVMLDSTSLKDRSKAEYIASTLEANKVSVLTATPETYRNLIKLGLKNFDLTSLRVCDCGGAILPEEIIEEFYRQTNVEITQGYGQTELTSLGLFMTKDSKGNYRFRSVGKPVSGGQYMIVDDSDQEVAVGEIGHLFIKGAMVMTQYDDPRLTKDVLTESGWYKTGDLFFRDEENFYYYVDKVSNRSDEGIVNIPTEVVLHEFESLGLDARPFLTVDSTRNVYAFVETKLLAEQDVLHQIRSRILTLAARHNIDFVGVFFIESFPLTATGKIDRRKLIAGARNTADETDYKIINITRVSANAEEGA